MKKKMLSIIATIAAFALFIPSVMAATTPVLSDDGKILFANGTPITIEALTEGEGALVKWEGGQLEVAATTAIFGGMHNDDTEVNTSITMNGGTVKHIFAGGLHKSNVDVAEVTLNGGTVTGSIMGGGYAGYINDADFSTSTYKPTDIEAESIVRVNEANVVINGGTIGTDVFGGGGGYSYTGTASVTIAETFNGNIKYVTAGGSNGYTDTASVEVNGGTINVLQAVNYGFMEESTLVVNGGKVTNAYASAEGADEDLGVEGKALLFINGGEVTNVAAGQTPATDATTTETTEIAVEYVEGTVTNVSADLDEEDVVLNVNLTIVAEIEGEVSKEVVQVPKGTILPEGSVNELEGLETDFNEYFEEEGLNYVFKGYYTDKEGTTKVDFTKAIDADTTWYILFAEKKAEELPPKTGDLNLVLLIGTIVVGAAGVVIVSKKRFAKSN